MRNIQSAVLYSSVQYIKVAKNCILKIENITFIKY